MKKILYGCLGFVGLLILSAAWNAASIPPKTSTSQTVAPTPTPQAAVKSAKPVEAPQADVKPAKPVEAPKPSPSPEPMTDAEQFKQLVLLKTDGILAYEAIQNIPAATLLERQKMIATTVKDLSRQGISIRQIKQSVADQLQIQQGYDEKLAYNVASAIIDGSLAWERGEKPPQ